MKLGVIAGAVYGFIAVFVSAFGLASIAVEFLQPLLFPASLLLRGIKVPGLFVTGIGLNMLLFAGIGYLLEKRFTWKWTVPCIYGGILVLVVLAVVLEAMTRGLSA